MISENENAPRPGESSQANPTESLGAVGRHLHELGDSVKNAAAEQVENIRHRAQEYLESGRQKATETEASIERYIQEQPLKSVLIAVGIGFVLGMSWRRRRA